VSQAGPTSPLAKIGIQLAVVEGTIVALVVGFLAVLNAVSPAARSGLAVVVGVALGLFAIAGLTEAIAALRAPQLPPLPDAPLPPTTGIIPAYLPNEAPLIFETIAHHLESAPEGHQLIVAYNTPKAMAIEEELARFAAGESRLTVLRVGHSQSKADNVNAALRIATGEIIAIFDADHHPSPGSYERAWRWIADGVDVVQGRCAVRRDPSASRWNAVLGSIVTAEFEQMYAVGHPGRARVQGFGLFGGSNGFWRADVLRRVGLDPSALTEDIDASVRLLRSGGKIVADPGIVSTELAPPSWDALCHQRLRWAQGWHQVARRHLLAVVGDPNIDSRKRLGVAWCFGMGSVLPWISALTVPLAIYGSVSGTSAVWKPLAGVLVAVGTMSFLAYLAVAYRHALPAARQPWVFGAFLLANFTFYGHLRVALVRLGHLHEFAGRTEWRVTPRLSPLGGRHPAQRPDAVDASGYALDGVAAAAASGAVAGASPAARASSAASRSGLSAASCAGSSLEPCRPPNAVPASSAASRSGLSAASCTGSSLEVDAPDGVTAVVAGSDVVLV
jgi:cellulose synthase/poly-beta-1,6-N-acetylglucosamine synthase-like glycosyltransferase